jgi:signal transduction histidine kinase/CheY-like chemotaxis protein
VRRGRPETDLTKDDVAEETRALRRCLREVVALTALPSIWAGREVAQIGDDLVDIVTRVLDPDAVFLSVHGHQPMTIARMRDEGDSDLIGHLRAVADAPLQSELQLSLGDQELRVLAYPLSSDPRDRLLAAALRPDFPTEVERLLLRVAATEALTWIERRNAEARLAALAVDNARLYREAQEANRAKDEFLANLSHELRTPMTAILGWAHLLHLGNLGAEDVRLGIETIRQSGMAQARLIDDLLDVSRIVSGKLQLHAAPIDLCEIVSAAVAAIHPAADAKRQRLELDCAVPRVASSGDAARLHQVFWNLLSNAVKFTPAGGSITVRVEQPDADHATVTVTDSGEGIPAAFLPLIFERFRQAATGVRGRSGLGLGLAICKDLVELHGGSVVAESAGANRGSTFSVTLPTHARGQAAQAAPVGVDREGAPLQSVRVLLVDDDAPTRTLLATALRNLGANVSAVESAAEAIAASSAFDPEVLITDIAMPGKDGIALLRVLRDGRASLPAIAVTAYADAVSRERIFAAGFNGFVAKPLDPDVLAAEIRRVRDVP